MSPYDQRPVWSGLTWREAAWLPIPLLGIAILVLSRMDLPMPRGPRFLVPVLSVLFMGCMYGLIALLSARSFLKRGSWSILFLGAGMLAFGLSSSLAGIFWPFPRGNVPVTVHNFGALAAGLCHLAGALVNGSRPAPEAKRPVQLTAAFLMVSLFILAISAAALAGRLPLFLDPMARATALRLLILGLAAALFTTAAVLFGFKYGRDRTLFVFWYCLGLGMTALGLVALLMQRRLGDLLTWTGWLGQVLGGLYVLFALLHVLRKNTGWNIPLDAALRESEARYRALVDLVPDAVLAIQEDRIVYGNEAALRLLAAPDEAALLRQAPIRLLPNEDWERIRRVTRELMAQGRSPPYEGQMLRLDGSAVTVEARFSRIDWQDSPALLVAVRDTTERRRIELSLKESELRYRRLYDSTIVAVVSGEGRRITRANNLFLELVGWTREEFDRAGMTWSDLSPPDATLLGGMYLEGMASGNSEKPVETVFLKKNGRRVPVLLALVPVTQDPFTWIALMLDLTEIQQSRDLLSRAKKQAEEAVGELARSNRDLEQFASVSSHDLKEPLRMVTAFLSLLNERLTGCLDPQSEEYIKIAMMSATRMQELIDDLLVYSCVAREAASTIVSAADAARLAIQNLETGIREADATVRVKALPAVKANAAELTQVFQNLISNAIKFRGSMNPEVDVGAVRDDGFWRFTVKDNGIGIDPAYQDRLFKIFNRLHTTDDYPGTGIGLAVCKKIVDRQGGRIWVESEPGRGSTFNFTLPAVLETE